MTTEPLSSLRRFENVENRFKTFYGRDLKSQTFQEQQFEAYVKSKALNIMTNLGMPKSERMTA